MVVLPYTDYIYLYSCAYCIGKCCSDITSDAMDELGECVCVNGDVMIDLSEQTNLTQCDFNFLKCLENVTGIFSLENVHLSSQIEVPCLQHIGGSYNDTALSVLNVSGGDIIFPKLAVITRGDVEFDIDSDSGVCGFRGINWTKILANGTLINSSRCASNGKILLLLKTLVVNMLVLPPISIHGIVCRGYHNT